jgi:hypothetical protein
MNNLISNEKAIHQCIMTDRRIAYSLACVLGKMQIDWHKVNRFDEFIPEHMKSIDIIPHDLSDSLKRKHYRARTFVYQRGMYAEALDAKDFKNVLLYGNKFILLFDTALQRQTWAHDMIAKLGHKSRINMEVKPYYLWSIADHMLREDVGLWMEKSSQE